MSPNYELIIGHGTTEILEGRVISPHISRHFGFETVDKYENKNDIDLYIRNFAYVTRVFSNTASFADANEKLNSWCPDESFS